MKKNKKLASSLIAFSLMASVLSGCNAVEQPVAADSGTGASDESAKAEASNESITEINMLICDGNEMSEKKDDVEAAINEITEELINVHVNLKYIPFSSYGDQFRLAISSGEQVDLACLVPRVTSFQSLYSQGALKDITDLLDEYGQQTKEVVGDYLNATTIGGRVYGVTNFNLIAGEQYLIMRKDVLEDLGLLEKAQNLTSFSEFEEIMQAVLDSDWDMYPIGTFPVSVRNPFEGDAFSTRAFFDPVSDSLQMCAVDINDPQAQVFNWFESDTYLNMITMMRDWYEKGYYYKDSAISGEDGYTMVKNGKAFSFLIGSEYGIDQIANDMTGMEMVCVPITDTMVTTATATTRVWVVPSTAKEDAAAVKMMNLLYSNAEIVNLFAWGIEGQDYQILENGNADYLDGQDRSTVHYHMSDYEFGNQFLALPWGADTETDLREIQSEKQNNGLLSPYMGFSCDTSGIADEISACSTVLDQYVASFSAGNIDLSEYDNFISALKAAGSETIVAEFQRQLDEFLGK